MPKNNNFVCGYLTTYEFNYNCSCGFSMYCYSEKERNLKKKLHYKICKNSEIDNKITVNKTSYNK
jgi:hypothetical protein